MFLRTLPGRGTGSKAIRLRRLKDEFAERMARTEVLHEWRLLQGSPVEAVTTCARYADITIVGQTDREDRGGRRRPGGPPGAGRGRARAGLALRRLRSTSVPRRCCWRGTAPARRSAHFRMRFRCSDRHTMSSSSASTRTTARHLPGAEASAHLARHGVKADARHRPASSDIAAADVLLSAISDYGVDLLVMGAYGHHRLRELLLGGMTRDILRRMTVPVLMSPLDEDAAPCPTRVRITHRIAVRRRNQGGTSASPDLIHGQSGATPARTGTAGTSAAPKILRWTSTRVSESQGSSDSPQSCFS